MATYAIGDIQGCFDSFQALLRVIGFREADDRLWLVGDLVNRGPKSLEVLRWMRSHDNQVTAVLGNHDLHLLGRAAGVVAGKKNDTLSKVLDASDRAELIDWLRHRPIMQASDEHAMVHAGLHPTWSIDDASRLAREIESVLRAKSWRTEISALVSGPVLPWRADLTGHARLRAASAVFCRLRMFRADGSMCEEYSGPPGAAPDHYTPWFTWPNASWRGQRRVIFGHWAALGLRVTKEIIALDSGCVWENSLTAFRLEDGAIFQVPAAERK